MTISYPKRTNVCNELKYFLRNMELSIMCPNLKYEIAPLTFMQFSPSKTPYYEKQNQFN
jgi:hypothetical protein